MPLTPFHLGPALLFGLLFLGFMHLPTFLIANVIVDLEPFIVLSSGIDYPPHGFFHSFLGGSMIAIILSLTMIRIDEKIQKIMCFFKLEQKNSQKNILIAAFSGVYLHILLDSFLYSDIKPFFPLEVNPLYNNSMSASFGIYGFCVISFILGAGLYTYLYTYKLLKH